MPWGWWGVRDHSVPAQICWTAPAFHPESLVSHMHLKFATNGHRLGSNAKLPFAGCVTLGKHLTCWCLSSSLVMQGKPGAPTAG